MVEKVKIIAPADDQLPFLLNNPRIHQEHYPYFMARIVDVERFLKQYPFKQTGSPISITLTDEKAKWNNGTYIISQEGISFNGEEKAEGNLSMDVQTLTALLLGSQQPSFLHECGKITGKLEYITQLEQIITKKPAAFIDFF
jgi:predicted acetyltransferase